MAPKAPIFLTQNGLVQQPHPSVIGDPPSHRRSCTVVGQVWGSGAHLLVFYRLPPLPRASGPHLVVGPTARIAITAHSMVPPPPRREMQTWPGPFGLRGEGVVNFFFHEVVFIQFCLSWKAPTRIVKPCLLKAALHRSCHPSTPN